MSHFRQLLVDPDGRICLPFPGWDTGLMRECCQPARFNLHDSLSRHDPIWICADCWDRIELDMMRRW